MKGEFIGRERELLELATALEDALQGRGRVILLFGEPGIGKTALAEELTRRAWQRGARVVWSRAWDGGGALPYRAWIQIIHELDRTSSEAARRHLTAAARGLALLVPELAGEFGTSAGPADLLESERGRFSLFESVSRFLREVSTDHPLVIVLDDVLGGDRASAQLLQFLAREAHGAPLLVVATCRDVDAQTSEGVELLARVATEGSVIELRGLELDEVRGLITTMTGATPWPSKAAAIHEATAGNPLFVREVTRLIDGEDPLSIPGRLRIPIPPSVRAVIRQRLAPLSADAVATLSVAALVGRDFNVALVEIASELPSERVAASITESVELGILTASDEAIGQYRFSHPLMREVFYEALPRLAKAQMHLHVGEAIESLYGPHAPGRMSDLALHFSKAVDAAAATKALHYARKAGDRAFDSWGYEEAAEMYRCALNALDQLPQDEAMRCELLLRLGIAESRAGAVKEAKASLLGAAAIARELGEPAQLARAALGAGEQQIGGGLVDRELVALLEEALEAMDSQVSPLRSRVLARLSAELTFSNEAVRREQLSQEALRMARRLGDPLALTQAWRARWMAIWGPNGLDERSSLAEEMLTLALENGSAELEVVARAQRITCSLEKGDIRAVDIDLAEHARLATELRMPLHEWTSATLRAMRTLLHGSVDAAEQAADDALLLLTGKSNASSAHLGQLTLVRWEQGRLGELRDTWHNLIEQFPQAGFGRGWLSLANAEIGRAEEAHIALRGAVNEVLALPQNGLWLLSLASSALAAAQLDDAEAAAAIYPLLLPHADRTIIVPMPHPIACYGPAVLYLGLLCRTMSRWEEADGYFQAAQQANLRLGAGAFLARTCCEHADLLLRRGRFEDRVQASELLRRAMNIARPLRLTAIGDRAAAMQLRVEARQDPSAVDTAGATDVFRREGDFWTVAHAGRIARARDSKGMRCLAELLSRPGREILALDLEASAGLADPRSGNDERALNNGLKVRMDLGDAGAMLDAQAKAAYKVRLEELREELNEAERFNDEGRIGRARAEIEFIMNELSRAVGLGGRDRRAASHAERARLNVTRAIRAALRNIARVHPLLAEHLSLTIRTGRFCSYTPDPRAPIRWLTTSLHVER